MTQPPDQPPPDGPPPPPGYRPPYQPYRAPQPSSRISGGLAVVGVMLYFGINFVLGYLTVAVSAGTGGKAGIGVGALVLFLIAFGGGAALLASKNGNYRGIGLGLMIGWALTSVLSVGYCTGLNPALYSS